eukprot:c18237_g1_i1 orf=150-443(+)
MHMGNSIKLYRGRFLFEMRGRQKKVTHSLTRGLSSYPCVQKLLSRHLQLSPPLLTQSKEACICGFLPPSTCFHLDSPCLAPYFWTNQALPFHGLWAE